MSVAPPPLPSNRILRSFAFRSGGLYRQVLAAWPRPTIARRPVASLPLLTMTGRRHLLMLEQCLFTLAQHAGVLPPLLIVSDGSAAPEWLASRLTWWPAPVTVRSPDHYREYHGSRGRTALVALSHREIFGLKLAAILAHAEEGPTWWCDIDMLFFQDYQTLLPRELPRAPCVLVAEDWLQAYDERLADGPLHHLRQKKPGNSGFAFAVGELYAHCGLASLIETALPGKNVYTEQTLMTEMAYRTGGIAWDLNTIAIFNSDQFTLGPTFRSQVHPVRHYISIIRHLFWRDALALRAGLQATALPHPPPVI